MSDDADWNHDTWSLRPDVLSGLATALQRLAEETDGFTFQALWVNDIPLTQGDVSLFELLDDVRENHVKNKHVYRVRRGAAWVQL